MLIGKVATEFCINIDTLRYYDKIGLLKPGRREGVRHYTQDDLTKLKNIIKMKNLMFSLDEISCLLAIDAEVEADLSEGKLDINMVEKMRQVIRHKQKEINLLEQDLQRVRHYLEGMMRKIEDVIK